MSARPAPRRHGPAPAPVAPPPEGHTATRTASKEDHR
jgi:hypothetical protein